MDKLNRPLAVATGVTVLIIGAVTAMRLAVDTAPVPIPAQLTSIEVGRPIAPTPPAHPASPPAFAPEPAAALSAAPKAATAAISAAPKAATEQQPVVPAAAAENKPVEKPARTTDPDENPTPRDSDPDRDTTRGWEEPDQGQRHDDSQDQLNRRSPTEDQMPRQMAGSICARYGMARQYCEQAASRPGN